MSGWYWLAVDRADPDCGLCDGEIENGEPPARDVRVFAEPLSAYAESGRGSIETFAAGESALKQSMTQRAHTAERWQQLEEAEWEIAEAAWSKLPTFDDLVRGVA